MSSSSYSSAGIGGAAVFFFLVLSIVLIYPRISLAGLGETSNAIEKDRLALNSKMRVIQHGSYTVYEIVSDERKVREFSGPGDGVVFAVTWKGATQIDLSVVLGKYLADFESVHAARHLIARGGGRTIRSKRLIVEESGHMRDIRGKAYVPALVPPGVKIAEVQ